MSSLYWSLTTLIKTPWVHPDTILEKVWASVIVVVGAIMFAAILGNITAKLSKKKATIKIYIWKKTFLFIHNLVNILGNLKSIFRFITIY